MVSSCFLNRKRRSAMVWSCHGLVHRLWLSWARVEMKLFNLEGLSFLPSLGGTALAAWGSATICRYLLWQFLVFLCNPRWWTLWCNVQTCVKCWFKPKHTKNNQKQTKLWKLISSASGASALHWYHSPSPNFPAMLDSNWLASCLGEELRSIRSTCIRMRAMCHSPLLSLNVPQWLNNNYIITTWYYMQLIINTLHSYASGDRWAHTDPLPIPYALPDFLLDMWHKFPPPPRIEVT